jgi:hypothetical protein
LNMIFCDPDPFPQLLHLRLYFSPLAVAHTADLENILVLGDFGALPNVFSGNLIVDCELYAGCGKEVLPSQIHAAPHELAA